MTRRTPALIAASLALAASLLALAVGRSGCGAPPRPDPDEAGPLWFEDAAAALGVDFVHDSGPDDGSFFMPRIVGSGVALFDFDNDGLLDVLLLHGGGPAGKKAKLYKQMKDGTFKDVSAGSGLDVAGHCQGVAAGDANDDGLPDVAISLYGAVKLFVNQGGGVFREATPPAMAQGGWATSLAFLDFDRDGRLDLFVTHYVAYDPSWRCDGPDGRRDFCAPKTFRGTVSRLYRNLGPGEGGSPRFEDVSVKSGITRKPGPGLGVVCADFTGDGWSDVFVANDGAPNHLWVNQKDGTFKEEAILRGVAFNAMGVAEANMGIGWGDVDGDGLQDVFVTHLDNETNTVWKQGPAGHFTDWTTRSRMHRPRWRATGFGTVLGDFDRDGHLDAAIVNGAVTRATTKPDHRMGPFWSQYAQRNQVFANDGTGRFKDISPSNPGLCGYDNVGRTLAMGDLRNDGRLWLVASGVADRVRVLKNVVAEPGGWLGVRVVVPVPGGVRDALGAEVRVTAGGRTQVRTAHTGGSFLCSNDPRVHFGLGKETGVESIEVLWPDGKREKFAGGPAGRYRVLEQGKGVAR